VVIRAWYPNHRVPIGTKRALLIVWAYTAESAALTKRQQTLLILIGRLQALSGMETPQKAEIEKIVLAASRSFSVVDNFDFPGEALGYSLKPSKGGEKMLN